ncbi:MAG TPA: hypothetical protein VFY13_05040 [Luteolibacter sp.]|nr:hypothetical protein [Luteolibacter sp.]
MDSIPQLSLGTAALVIFFICVLYMMLRGIARMLVGTVLLAASCAVAVLTWQQAPGWSVLVFGKPLTAITTGLPIVAFIACMLLLRLLLKWITRPFSDPDAEEEAPARPSGMKWIALLLVALLPTAILALMAAVFIHHRASIAELRAHADPKIALQSRSLRELGTRIEKLLPAKLLGALDPFTSKNRIKLAKALSSQPDSGYEPVIDPETGKPIPRAILVEDPQLQRLLKGQEYGALLRHPAMAEALKNPEVRKKLEQLK